MPGRLYISASGITLILSRGPDLNHRRTSKGEGEGGHNAAIDRYADGTRVHVRKGEDGMRRGRKYAT